MYDKRLGSSGHGKLREGKKRSDKKVKHSRVLISGRIVNRDPRKQREKTSRKLQKFKKTGRAHLSLIAAKTQREETKRFKHHIISSRKKTFRLLSLILGVGARLGVTPNLGPCTPRGKSFRRVHAKNAPSSHQVVLTMLSYKRFHIRLLDTQFSDSMAMEI